MKKILMVGLLSVASSGHATEVLIDFEGQAEDGYSELAIQNVTFLKADEFQIISVFDYFALGNILDGTMSDNILLAGNMNQALRIDFENAVSSFSFGMQGSSSTDWQLEVFNDSGELIDSSLTNIWSGFIGSTSTVADISYATFMGTNVYGDSPILTMDNFKYTEVSPVPEPSTYALMLGGLGLVGFMAYRRKKVLS